MNAQEMFDQLSAPFAEEMIDWRVGSTTQDKSKGMALAYIDARAVQDRFDTVCGMNGWQCNYTATGNGSIACNIGVLVDGAWIWKANGAGKTDFEAEKGMYSDAFKRAAVMFGVGRYLYDLDSPWVELEGQGRRIAKAEVNKLNELHAKFAQKYSWGPPADVAVYKLLNRVVDEFVTDAVGANDFRKHNEGMIAQLRVAQRKHLNTKLDRIGAPAEAAE